MADPKCLEKVTTGVTEFLRSGARTSDPARVIEPMPQAPRTEEPETRRRELVPRRLRLSPNDFETHGYTAGCPECRHLSTGQGHRQLQSVECQARIENAIKATDEGKVRFGRGEERISKWMEEQHDKEHSRAGEGEAAAAEKGADDYEDRIIATLAKGNGVTNIFSPARVAKVCAKFGLVPGTSMDLTTGWDFDLASHRR